MIRSSVKTELLKKDDLFQVKLMENTPQVNNLQLPTILIFQKPVEKQADI